MAEAVITLQQAEMPDHTLPYPFFVTAEGAIGRQDFWRGEPARVIGFVDDPESTELSPWSDYVEGDPQAAVGQYVVTEDVDGTWSTRLPAIATVTERL